MARAASQKMTRREPQERLPRAAGEIVLSRRNAAKQ
jgi:hypothetical protein